MLSNIFDVVFILLYLVVFALGLLKGFWKELFSLLGLSAGYYLAIRFSGYYPEFLKNFVSQFNAQLIIFTITIFLGWILGELCSKLFTVFFSLSFRSSLNRFLGGMLGFLRATVLYLCIFFLAGSLQSFQDEVQDSWVVPFFKNLTQFIQDFHLVVNTPL